MDKSAMKISGETETNDWVTVSLTDKSTFSLWFIWIFCFLRWSWEACVKKEYMYYDSVFVK